MAQACPVKDPSAAGERAPSPGFWRCDPRLVGGLRRLLKASDSAHDEDDLDPEGGSLGEASIGGHERGRQPASEADVERVPQRQVVPQPPGGSEERLQGIAEEGSPGQLIQDRLDGPLLDFPPADEAAERREHFGIEMSRNDDPMSPQSSFRSQPGRSPQQELDGC